MGQYRHGFSASARSGRQRGEGGCVSTEASVADWFRDTDY
jgi:hypothetical protein